MNQILSTGFIKHYLESHIALLFYHFFFLSEVVFWKRMELPAVANMFLDCEVCVKHWLNDKNWGFTIFLMTRKRKKQQKKNKVRLLRITMQEWDAFKSRIFKGKYMINDSKNVVIVVVVSTIQRVMWVITLTFEWRYLIEIQNKMCYILRKHCTFYFSCKNCMVQSTILNIPSHMINTKSFLFLTHLLTKWTKMLPTL